MRERQAGFDDVQHRPVFALTGLSEFGTGANVRLCPDVFECGRERARIVPASASSATSSGCTAFASLSLVTWPLLAAACRRLTPTFRRTRVRADASPAEGASFGQS